VLGGGPAQAAGVYPPGWVGYDISFPQCGAALGNLASIGGHAPQFSVLGVSGGKAFTNNPCLASQYLFAAGQGTAVSFYVNVNAPRAVSDAPSGPKGPCAAQDLACASYNYGWATAQAAYDYALQTVQASGGSWLPTAWWLDVENGNYWLPDPTLNAQAIQGAIDLLQTSVANPSPNGTTPVHTLTVGIYSDYAQWSEIAGHFKPNTPVWLATHDGFGALTRDCAASSFTSGPLWLIQSIGLTDADYSC
jgi:hypothetical protein